MVFIKDLLIEDDKIFISFTEIIDNCWNTSLIYGEINYEKINFKNSLPAKIVLIQEKN